jgi:hypothetical protein
MKTCKNKLYVERRANWTRIRLIPIMYFEYVFRKRTTLAVRAGRFRCRAKTNRGPCENKRRGGAHVRDEKGAHINGRALARTGSIGTRELHWTSFRTASSIQRLPLCLGSLPIFLGSEVSRMH